MKLIIITPAGVRLAMAVMPQWRVSILHKALYDGLGASTEEAEREQVTHSHTYAQTLLL
jgi:hypothetical protein